MEQNDAVLFGHLVLYHIVDAQDQQQNIQLWHSDYSNNGSKAIIDVRFICNYSLCPVHVKSLINVLSFYVTKTVLVRSKWFWSDQIDLDLPIMIWS